MSKCNCKDNNKMIDELIVQVLKLNYFRDAYIDQAKLNFHLQTEIEKRIEKVELNLNKEQQT